MDELLSQDEINALLSGGAFEPSSPSGLSMEDTQVLDEVATVFSNSESSVFGMLAGKDVDTAPQKAEVVHQSELRSRLEGKVFVFRATFGGFDDLPMAFVLEQRGALTLADLMMGGEGKELPEEAGDLYLNAAQEGLSQVVGAALTGLSGLLGGRRLIPENTVSALEEGEWLPFPDIAPETQLWGSLSEVNIDGLESFGLWTVMPLEQARNLADGIRLIMNEQAPKPAAAPSKHEDSPSSPQSFSPARGAQSPAPPIDVRPAEFAPLTSGGIAGRAGGGKIDMIADIPVRVTVELGKTRKSISEILSMSTGSVIELDKMAGEPVDVLVNGKLIARGEVVVIDENFGVRITEVLNASAKAWA